jgi:hypothetical protein
LIPAHDELMNTYDMIYKRSREVYEETIQGGYTKKKNEGLTPAQEVAAR